MRISDWSSDVCSSDLLVVRDDEGKPAVGVRRLTEAISSDKLRYFVGNFSSAVGLAELEVARQEKVLQYAAGGSEDFTGSRCSPYTFQWRSEEHTSELQSLMRISYAVFCLKNKIRYIT